MMVKSPLVISIWIVFPIWWSGIKKIRLYNNAGVQVWESQLPGSAGPTTATTVADFDGDGRPEIGASGDYEYTVFNDDGQILWYQSIDDEGSGVTGSSVFDFGGDGIAEVVYADENNLWVYSGLDGTVLLQEENHANGTLYEYPTIADVDNDGSSEIILASSNVWGWDGWGGLTVIGAANKDWFRSRPVWNQQNYSISNVNDDLTIPSTIDSKWDLWNNFRAAGILEGKPEWRGDLKIEAIDTCYTSCEENQANGLNGEAVSFYITVSNTGLLPVLDAELRFELVQPFGANQILMSELFSSRTEVHLWWDRFM